MGSDNEVGVKKIIVSRPKLVVDTYCQKCKSRDISALSEVEVTCNNCKTKFTTDTGVNLYYSIAKKLNQLLGKNNEVWLLAEREDSDVYCPENILKARSKNEDDKYHTLLSIKQNFEDMKCWVVSEIISTEDWSYQAWCQECGHCFNCVTCTKCKQKYIPKLIGAKKEKRFTCTKCGHKNYAQTRFKKSVVVDGVEVCPYCKSANVKHSRFASGKRQCPVCKSKNVSAQEKIPVYKLVIKRQERFWRYENV